MSQKPVAQIPPEFLKQFMPTSLQTPDRVAFANKTRDMFMRDPELLAEFEKLFGHETGTLAKLAPTEAELKSFGWGADVKAMNPAVVAAAAATWGAAAAQHVSAQSKTR
jgi:hypothetical protein